MTPACVAHIRAATIATNTIITGDVTQIDLPRGQYSGLKHASKVLADINGISFTRFLPRDVVRHPLVQRIVEAYEKNDEQAASAAATDQRSSSEPELKQQPGDSPA